MKVTKSRLPQSDSKHRGLLPSHFLSARSATAWVGRDLPPGFLAQCETHIIALKELICQTTGLGDSRARGQPGKRQARRGRRRGAGAQTSRATESRAQMGVVLVSGSAPPTVEGRGLWSAAASRRSIFWCRGASKKP